MSKLINLSVLVNASQEQAFNSFTDEFQSWWPAAYTLSQDTLVSIGIEAKEGGLCSELGPHGFRCDWGRVLRWSPPELLVLLWQVNQNSAPEPNPAKSSEVRLRFEQVDSFTTSVELEHLYLHRHGDGSDTYCDELASEHGWPFLLKEFQKFQNGKTH